MSVTTIRVVPAALVDLGHGPHLDRPLAGPVGVEDALTAEDRAPRWGSRDPSRIA